MSDWSIPQYSLSPEVNRDLIIIIHALVILRIAWCLLSRSLMKYVEKRGLGFLP